jgi:hypothetical protein
MRQHLPVFNLQRLNLLLKRKSSEQVLDVELQVASSLAHMSQKKAKKAVKKIVAAEV